jgi:flagellar biosynthesis/type III secretory pathway chaperone
VTTAVTPPLHSSLQLEIAGYRGLLELLERECDALRRLDVEGIEASASAKQTQVQALDQLARRRKDQLATCGLPVTGAGMAQWFAGSEDPSAANGAWATLLDLARAARQANIRNGRMLARQRQHYDAALSALLHAAGIPAVYGADGRAHAATGSRSLAAI